MGKSAIKMGKCLTVKDLKDAFGSEYSTVNNLVAGKSDDYVFGSLTTVNTNDYFVSVLWGREDIEYFLSKKGIEPTSENIECIFSDMKKSDLNDTLNMHNDLLNVAQSAIENAIESRFPEKCN